MSDSETPASTFSVLQLLTANVAPAEEWYEGTEYKYGRLVFRPARTLHSRQHAHALTRTAQNSALRATSSSPSLVCTASSAYSAHSERVV